MTIPKQQERLYKKYKSIELYLPTYLRLVHHLAMYPSSAVTPMIEYSRVDINNGPEHHHDKLHNSNRPASSNLTGAFFSSS